jgi:hypothetical protein
LIHHVPRFDLVLLLHHLPLFDLLLIVINDTVSAVWCSDEINLTKNMITRLAI